MLAGYLAWRFVGGITKTRYHGRSQNEAQIREENEDIEPGQAGHGEYYY